MQVNNNLMNRFAQMSIGNTSSTIDTIDSADSVSQANSTNENGAMSFLDTLKGQLDNLNEKELQADSDTQKLIAGDNVDIHQVMVSTEEAKLSLQLAVQVRNKILDAYQELNRMQL